MSAKLDDLARRLRDCVKRGHRRSLDDLLAAARILGRAKALARGGFGQWVREHGRMDWSTACRYLKVSKLVRANLVHLPNLRGLGLRKLYVLITLEPEDAKNLLAGRARLSAPIDKLTDLRFQNEIRKLFPRVRRRRTVRMVFRSVSRAVQRAAMALHAVRRDFGSLDPLRRRKLLHDADALIREFRHWAAKRRLA